MSLALGASQAFAHVGHGDEFQAEGGINRVEVNADTDTQLGIQVSAIQAAVDGSSDVMIPLSALVEDNGQQLVFVQYENFYEPVPVTVGDVKGEMVAILEGLSVGEQLVTQGSLSLYAESRKSQTAEASPEIAAPEETSAIAASSGETTEASLGSPIAMIATVGTSVVLIAGVMVFVTRGKKGGV